MGLGGQGLGLKAQYLVLSGQGLVLGNKDQDLGGGDMGLGGQDGIWAWRARVYMGMRQGAGRTDMQIPPVFYRICFPSGCSPKTQFLIFQLRSDRRSNIPTINGQTNRPTEGQNLLQNRQSATKKKKKEKKRRRENCFMKSFNTCFPPIKIKVLY